jgi:hypothetical protein
MNLHPSILAHAAFIDRPRSRVELYNVIGVIEGKSSVMEERRRQEGVVQSLHVGVVAHVSRITPRRVKPLGAGLPKCWGCGWLGHIRRDCLRKPSVSGNESLTGNR